MPRLTPADLVEWRRQLAEEGDGEALDPTTAQAIAPLLMAEVEALWADVGAARLAALREAAQLLEKRLVDVKAWGGNCPVCKDGEAGGFVFRLREMAVSRRPWLTMRPPGAKPEP
jgi:hypothetical protein